jgi:hypothetical protein
MKDESNPRRPLIVRAPSNPTFIVHRSSFILAAGVA